VKVDEAEENQQTTYKVTTIRTRGQRLQEKVFDDLKIDQQSQSNRSFDFEEYEVTNSSEDSCPLRDIENSDWPSNEALKKIPTKVLCEKGLLLYKGKMLSKIMSLFYNTSCQICNEKFKRITELFEHYKLKHLTEPFVTCCSLKLSKLPRIIWHFVKHIQPESFKCKICSYTVSRPKFLELHLQTHSKNKPYSCDQCEKTFIWKGALRSHLVNHQSESERKLYICPTCSRKYQTAGSLASHKKSAHSEIVKSKNLCEVCSKSFSTLTSYKEHMIQHSEDSEKLQLKCNVCQKWLKNQRCLKSHMLLHSNVDFKCEICDYVTKKEKLLKNHIITRHTKERPWTCDSCEKNFKVKRALTLHKAQNHAENKKTAKICEFCNREFASSTNYYTHRKNLHAAELQQILQTKKEEEKMKRIEIGLE
jgi:C2H2-type zinc finger/Zinc finger, C2H2 type